MGHGFQFAMLNNQMVLNGIGFTIISAMQQEPKKNGGTYQTILFLLGLRKGICPQFSLFMVQYPHLLDPGDLPLIIGRKITSGPGRCSTCPCSSGEIARVNCGGSRRANPVASTATSTSTGDRIHWVSLGWTRLESPRAIWMVATFICSPNFDPMFRKEIYLWHLGALLHLVCL